MYRDNAYKKDIKTVAQKVTDVYTDAVRENDAKKEGYTHIKYPDILNMIESIAKTRVTGTSIEKLLGFIPEGSKHRICWETLVVLLKKDGFDVREIRNSSNNLTTNSCVYWYKEKSLEVTPACDKIEKRRTLWYRFVAWLKSRN